MNSARESENQQEEILLPTPNPFIEKINEDTLIVEKNSFVAFICKTVNVAMQQKRKSDRIKTIVEAAVEILGFKEITAELMYAMLNQTNYDGLSQGN